jgi:hypothetical protein
MNALLLELRKYDGARASASGVLNTMSRWLVIGLLITAAIAHIPVVPEHLREAPYMGVLFILFTVAALAAAGALVLGPSAVRYALAAGLCVAAVGAYSATRLVAFPQLADDVGMWGEPLGVLSVATESAVVLISVVKIAHMFPSLGQPSHEAS